MSEPIILLLPDWVQQHITTLYNAKTADDFNTAFDAFISHHVSIKVNGKSMSRDQYKKLIMGEITNDVSADVSFSGVISVPDATKDRPAVVVSARSGESPSDYVADTVDLADRNGRSLLQGCRFRQALRARTPHLEHRHLVSERCVCPVL